MKTASILFGILIAILLIPSVASAPSLGAVRNDYVKMIENYQSLTDPYTIYEVCNPAVSLSTISVSKESDFNITLQKPGIDNVMSSGMKELVSQLYYVDLPIEKDVLEGNKTVRITTGYRQEARYRDVWRDFNPYGKTWTPGTCKTIKVWAHIKPVIGDNGIDNIMSFDGMTFSEYAWWNTSARQCMNITIINDNNFPVYSNSTMPITINLTGIEFQNATMGVHIVDEGCLLDGSEVNRELLWNGTNAGLKWADFEIMNPNISANSNVNFSAYVDFQTEYEPHFTDSFTVYDYVTSHNFITPDFNITFQDTAIADYVKNLKHVKGNYPNIEWSQSEMFNYGGLTRVGSPSIIAYASGTDVNGTFIERSPFRIKYTLTTIHSGNISYTLYDNLPFFRIEYNESNATESSHLQFKHNVTGNWSLNNWSQSDDWDQIEGGDASWNTSIGMLALTQYGERSDSDSIYFLMNTTEDQRHGTGVSFANSNTVDRFYIGTKGFGVGTQTYTGWNNLTYWYGYSANHSTVLANETYWSFVNNPITVEFGIARGPVNYTLQNETYNDVVPETTNQLFEFTLWVNTTLISNVNASLIWNGSEYFNDSFQQAGSYMTFGRNITMPSINDSDEENVSFYWNYTVFYIVDATHVNDTTPIHNQTILRFFQTYNISLFIEDDWTTPFEINDTDGVELFLYCEGGGEFVFNLTETYTDNIKPFCRVDSIMVRVNYPTDSYTRQIIAPDADTANISMYLVDAFNVTLLQIPFFMDDYKYYESSIRFFKSTVNDNYVITEGLFDTEHKFVAYLIKDSKYIIRIQTETETRDIGFFYSSLATEQHISISGIKLRPDISLISDNLLMSAEVDNVTELIRVQYTDLTEQTTSVRIRIYEGVNQTAFFDMTYNNMNIISVTTPVNISKMYSVLFTVEHEVFGNSPIDFTVAAGVYGFLFNLGISSWLYPAIGFVLMLFTSFVIVPKNRLAGLVFMIIMLAILIYAQWLVFASATLVLLIIFVALSIVYEMKTGREG